MQPYRQSNTLLKLFVFVGVLVSLVLLSNFFAKKALAACTGSGGYTEWTVWCASPNTPDSFCDDALINGGGGTASCGGVSCTHIIGKYYGSCKTTGCAPGAACCGTNPGENDVYGSTGCDNGGATATPTPKPTSTPAPGNKYTISISCLGNGSGTVKQKSDGKVLCTCTAGNKTGSCEKEDLTKGSNNTFTKTVNPGSSFNSWSHGTCPSGTDCSPCEDGGNCNINNITGDLTIKAKFDLAATSTPTPTPVPQPAVVTINGSLQEYAGNTCKIPISATTLSINVNPDDSKGVTTNNPCPVVSQSSYSCTITFDPTMGANLNQNLNLSVITTPYTSAYWTNNSACSNSANNVLPVVLNPGDQQNFSKDIFFTVSDWVKLKNASVAATGALNNVIPNFVDVFDNDDNGARYYVINDSSNSPGTVTAAGTINLGTAAASSYGWQGSNANVTRTMDVPTYAEYIKSRKTSFTISCNDSTCSNLKKDIKQTGSGYIYLINPRPGGNVTFNDNGILGSTDKVVFLVQGDVKIDTVNQFNASGKSFAILSTGTITITDKVDEVDGLYIANTITTDAKVKGFKIVGNLVSKTFVNNRTQDDKFKPSVFIVFDPKYYIDLLQLLSTSTYDWKQLQ